MYGENPIICVLIQLPLLLTEEGQKCSMWTRGQFPRKIGEKCEGRRCESNNVLEWSYPGWVQTASAL
jgi:hypothetical protein